MTIPDPDKTAQQIFCDFTFSFDVLEKSSTTPNEDQALKIPEVKRFLDARGEFSENNLVLIHGHFSVPDKDRQGDEVDPEAFKKSLTDYITGSSNGVVLYVHDVMKSVGNIIYHKITDRGPYVVAYVDHPETVQEIRTGKIRAFSFYAKVKKAFVDYENKTRKTTDLDMIDVSITPIPQNTGAGFSILKSVGAERPARFLPVEDLSEEQEKSLLKGMTDLIRNIFVKSPEAKEAEITKSMLADATRWQQDLEGFENNVLQKVGKKIASSRLDRLVKAYTQLKEVLGEVIDDFETEIEKENKLKKSKQNAEVDEMELNDVKTIVTDVMDSKLTPVFDQLKSVSARQDSLERAAGMDPESTMKKSIETDLNELFDSKFNQFTAGLIGKVREVMDPMDERLKKLELKKSASRVGKPEDAGDPPAEPRDYAKMTPGERDEYWKEFPGN